MARSSYSTVALPPGAQAGYPAAHRAYIELHKLWRSESGPIVRMTPERPRATSQIFVLTAGPPISCNTGLLFGSCPDHGDMYCESFRAMAVATQMWKWKRLQWTTPRGSLLCVPTSTLWVAHVRVDSQYRWDSNPFHWGFDCKIVLKRFI